MQRGGSPVNEERTRQNKHENTDNYFTLARATEEKLQQMAEIVETTDKEGRTYQKNYGKNQKTV